MPPVPANPVPLSHWLAFGGLVAVLLILDLGVFHRKNKEPTLRGAAIGTAFWLALALAFNVYIWVSKGAQAAQEFLAGYLVEWSLSMDNVFVFAVIFSFFRVEKKYQYRVLFWGIMGAVFMRLAFVLLGAALIQRFDWILYVLGLFLLYTGFKLAMQGDEDAVDPEHSWVLKIARKLLPVSKIRDDRHFVIREEGKLKVTPLFMVLLVVESTDVAFAVDSVPAIFGITKDPFIVFTSNIFAILGLRALYFLLAGVMDLFRYLRHGLAAILIYVGIKMLAHGLAHPPEWFVNAFGHPPEWAAKWLGAPPPWFSLAVIFSILTISIVASLIAAKLRPPQHDEHLDAPPESREEIDREVLGKGDAESENRP